jgi:hypothetical protein
MLEEFATQGLAWNSPVVLRLAWAHVVLRASEAGCDSKYKKKPTRGVSEEARDINKIYTWHCCVVEGMADFMRE